MFHAELFEDLAGLGQDGVAVVGSDAGIEVDLEASAIARFERNVKVGADISAVVTGFGDHGRRIVIYMFPTEAQRQIVSDFGFMPLPLRRLKLRSAGGRTRASAPRPLSPSTRTAGAAAPRGV